MFSGKDYSTLTLDELMAEEKKLKSNSTATAFAIGMLVGVAVIAAVNGKFIFTIVLLAVGYLIGYRDTQNKKNLKAEIARRNSVG